MMIVAMCLDVVLAVTILANIAEADLCTNASSHTIIKQKTGLTCCTVPVVFYKATKVISFYVVSNKGQYLLNHNIFI